MKTYTVYYKIGEDKYVGSGRGNNEAEALHEFEVFHSRENYEIEKVELYK
jgi:hypothetical protein